MSTGDLYDRLLVLAHDAGDVDLDLLAFLKGLAGDLLVLEQIQLSSVVLNGNSASAGLHLRNGSHDAVVLLLAELSQHLLTVDLSQVALDGLLSGESSHSAQLGDVQLLEDSTAHNSVGVDSFSGLDIYLVLIDRLIGDDLLSDIHCEFLGSGVDLHTDPLLAVGIGSSSGLEHSGLYLLNKQVSLDAVLLSQHFESLEKVFHYHFLQ